MDKQQKLLKLIQPPEHVSKIKLFCKQEKFKIVRIATTVKN